MSNSFCFNTEDRLSSTEAGVVELASEDASGAVVEASVELEEGVSSVELDVNVSSVDEARVEDSVESWTTSSESELVVEEEEDVIASVDEDAVEEEVVDSVVLEDTSSSLPSL